MRAITSPVLTNHLHEHAAARTARAAKGAAMVFDENSHRDAVDVAARTGWRRHPSTSTCANKPRVDRQIGMSVRPQSFFNIPTSNPSCFCHVAAP